MSLITQLSKVVVLEQPPEGISRIPDKLWPFIWFFLRQYRWSFLAIALCFVVSTTLMSSSSYFIKLIVDTLGQTGSRADIITDVFWIFAGYVLLCGVMQSIFWRLAEYFCTYVYPSFTNTVRGQLNVYVNRHSYEYFQNDFAGRLSSKVTETPKAVLALIKEFIEGFVYNAVVFAVSFTLLAMTGLYQLLIMLGVSVLYVVTLRVFLPRVKRLSQMTSDYMSFIRGHHVDMMANILNIKLFSKQKYENKRFFGVLQEGANKYHIKDTQLFKFMCKLDTIMKLIWMLPVAYALYAWQDGITTAGDVAMVMALSIQLGNTMWSFSFTVSNFFENLGQVQEGMETITQALNVQDQPNAPKMDIQNADIRFSNMSFSYGKNGVFEDFNLHIKAGEKVGIVGPSGAGKSSLIQLLLRLYDIQAGEVLIGGQNIQKVTQNSLREHIAVIPQMTDLFHRSLRENIRYGQVEASDEDVVEAAKRAHAHEFILNMQDSRGNVGYDSTVGERGVKLSGGQRQRIAIARAILKNAPILVLDEATSALDSETEKLIQDSLIDLMQDKTVIAIAHRLSTIKQLDRLIVMDQGKIVEDGTHEQLLKKKGHYAKLWNMQSGGFI